jgi:sugar phosphate isomerase/epimerase
MQRREFLSRTAQAAASAVAAAPTAWAARNRRPLGLQLFTIMTELERDFEGTLRSIADIGYREVETIGAMGRDPKAVRAALDRSGLRTPSQHLMAGDLYANFLKFTRREITADDVQLAWKTQMAIERIVPVVEEAIARAQVLGQKYIVLQIVWPDQMQTRTALADFCRGLNTAGRLCAKAGMTFNFHNHSDEFRVVDGQVPYHVIVESTDPDLVKLELDVYWAVRAGADPAAYFRRYPGRYVQCHLKDSAADGDFATVGKGVIDFPRILAAARRAGLRHYYVEYDRADDPMAVTRDAYHYLSKLM